MKKYSQFLLPVFFLIPAFADIIFTLFSFSNLLGITLPGSTNFTPNGFILLAGFLISICIYIFISLYILLSFITPKSHIYIFLNSFYKRNKIYILTSIILSISTYTTYLIPTFFLSFYFYIPFELIIVGKFLFIILSILTVRYIRSSKLTRLLGAVYLIVTTVFISIFFIGIIHEFIPKYFFTFPLNDTKGVYMLNYDGDYWLTYYEVKQECDTSKKCSDVLVKKGNTSITETPVDLKKYIDRPVVVTGEFVRTHGPLSGAEKKLCVGWGFSKKCFLSNGHGNWHASPLKIQSIEIIGD